jgi:hypothetical protein
MGLRASSSGLAPATNPARRQPGGPPSTGADQVRDGGQPEYREGARTERSAWPARRRRPGDRMKRREVGKVMAWDCTVVSTVTRRVYGAAVAHRCGDAEVRRLL